MATIPANLAPPALQLRPIAAGARPAPSDGPPQQLDQLSPCVVGQATTRPPSFVRKAYSATAGALSATASSVRTLASMAGVTAGVALHTALSEKAPRAPLVERYGSWGVVAGAGGDAGEAYARQLASRGMNVVLAGGDAQRLQISAASIEKDYGVSARSVVVDMSSAELMKPLEGATQDLDVGTLVVAPERAPSTQPFLQQDGARLIDDMHANDRAGLILSHEFGQRFSARGRGAVVLVGGQSAPDNVFLRNLSVGLAHEPGKVDHLYAAPSIDPGRALDRVGQGSTAEPSRWSQLAGFVGSHAYAGGLAGSLAMRDLAPEPAVKPAQSAAPASSAPSPLAEKYGPWALVTGGSSGIGKELARQLASQGLNLVLVARQPDKLKEVSDQLQKDYGVEVKTLPVDLTAPDAMDKVKASLHGVDLGLVVNDAGWGNHGRSLDSPLQTELNSQAINQEVSTRVTHDLGQMMAEKGRGGMIVVGSAMGYQGAPYMATYAASKGYDIELSKQVGPELKARGVDFLMLNPAATDTPANKGVDMSKTGLTMSTPASVVTQALEGLGKKSEVIPGAVNQLMFKVGTRLMPSDLNAEVARKLYEKAL